MPGAVPLDLGWLVAGALLLALAYLIRGRGWTFLVAGHDEGSAISERVIATSVGNLALRVGVLSVLAGLFAPRLETRYLGPVIAGLIVLDTALVLYRLNAGDRAPE
jgi:hypothetical protein